MTHGNDKKLILLIRELNNWEQKALFEAPTDQQETISRGVQGLRKLIDRLMSLEAHMIISAEQESNI